MWRMKCSYVMVVIGLLEVPLSRAVNKEVRDTLLFALTNEVFFCGPFLMLDVVHAWALMWEAFLIAQRCAQLLDHSVEACVAELDGIANWAGREWKQFNTALVLHPGSNTRFYGVALHNPQGQAEFDPQAASFLAKAGTKLQTRFSDTHPVAKATNFLDFFYWPWHDAAALAV